MSWFETRKEFAARMNQEAHNKGQEDASKGVCNPPNAIVAEVFFQSAKDENEAYRSGQQNHKNQKE